MKDVNDMTEEELEAYGEELYESYIRTFPPEPDKDGDVYDGPALR